MNHDKSIERLWTISEVSKVYNLKESWIRRQIFLKRIPFIKMGRLIRFNIWELDQWVHKGISNR